MIPVKREQNKFLKRRCAIIYNIYDGTSSYITGSVLKNVYMSAISPKVISSQNHVFAMNEEYY